MKKPIRLIYVDLVTDTADLIRIQCPYQFEDELYETLTNSMQRGDRWSTNQFDGCRAEFLGQMMDSINMKRIIGFA